MTNGWELITDAADSAHPRLTFEPSVTGPELAAALRSLPPEVSAVVEVVALGRGRDGGRVVAAQAAADLGESVTLRTTATDGWTDPAAVLRCLPDGREKVVASTPPQPGLVAIDAATYTLDEDWLVRVSGNGLHAMPAGPAVPAPAPYEPRPGAPYRIVVGTPGAPIADPVWPVLSALLIAALNGIPGEVLIEVAGEPTAWGRTAAAELAERYGGSHTATVVLPVVPAEEPVRRRRPGRLLIAAAAVVVALGAGTVALVWPHGGDGDGAAGSPANGYTGPGVAPDASGSAAGARGQASVRASRSSARPSGSASATASGPPSPGPEGSAGPSQPPLNLNVFNLAAGRVTRDSGHADVYGSGNVADADPGTYWESRSNAFPAWVQVDLGNPATARRAVLRLPPSDSWPARTQRIELQGSNDDKTFTTVVGAATYSFDAASGQRASVTLPGTPWRYIRVVFTANSLQAAGQLSSLELYLA
ncbi:discoidin domain-containing protein [Dactylosporangium vinaceum]|uniref:Discoidin domain-containing protein n=1 Tax=Dactylosporangium vinaceum TaxID=53362 RepID=A0ABV5MM95_9ACTN|nr:discoidin domain-containing protein [Dactylosporangium vinaceum]UAB93298.1 discoidin domain-containing protein [Dactylosporangium vinaceum]